VWKDVAKTTKQNEKGGRRKTRQRGGDQEEGHRPERGLEKTDPQQPGRKGRLTGDKNGVQWGEGRSWARGGSNAGGVLADQRPPIGRDTEETGELGHDATKKTRNRGAEGEGKGTNLVMRWLLGGHVTSEATRLKRQEKPRFRKDSAEEGKGNEGAEGPERLRDE